MFDTMILAMDGSAASARATDYAAALAKGSGARIVAVHVKELMAGRAAGPVHVDEEEIQAAVRARVARLDDDGLAVELEMPTALGEGPAHLIAEAAKNHAADVIVTGTRGHTALAGVVLGSVAQRLLHIAPCPVLVVPEAATGAATGAAANAAAGRV